MRAFCAVARSVPIRLNVGVSEILVILDSNALNDDPKWQRPSAGKLLALARRRLVSVAVPQVVLMELERQRVTTIANKLDQLKAAPRKIEAALAELGITAEDASMTVPDLPALTPKELLAKYKAQVEVLLSSSGVDVLPIPTVAHEVMLERDLSRRKPFELTGRGYRDALIWESVLARYRDTGVDAEVYFVTNDNDFGEGGLLDPQLEEELPETGATFIRVATLDALFHEESLQEPRLMLQHALDSMSPNTVSALAESAVDSYVERLSGESVENEAQDSLEVPAEIEDLQIESATSLGNFVWSAYDEFDDTTVLGVGAVDVELTLRGYVSKANAATLADAELRVEGWEDDVATVLLDREANASFDLRVEVTGESVEDITFLGLGPN